MGVLVDGVWKSDGLGLKNKDGKFIRSETTFRHQITPDGPFKPEADRYHLYVSLACPWAHRTLIFRKLKGLEDLISVTVVDPLMLDNGWEFGDDPDPINGFDYLHQVYSAADGGYNGRSTVPILWDKQTGQIVNNESAEIIRIFNSAFNDLTGNDADYYPEAQRDQIDEINAFVYDNINNGVYKCGFATRQPAYEEAFAALFSALDKVEAQLSNTRYLIGDTLTEADWRLFTTLIRFDQVYNVHFKCNRQRIEDFPNLREYIRELYQVDGVAETVNFDHIKRHYYMSHTSLNPTQIVPVGPDLDLDRPFQR